MRKLVWQQSVLKEPRSQKGEKEGSCFFSFLFFLRARIVVFLVFFPLFNTFIF